MSSRGRPIRRALASLAAVTLLAALPRAQAPSWCFEYQYALPLLSTGVAAGSSALYAVGAVPGQGPQVRIARRDGATWSLLPGVFDKAIRALVETPTGLLAGGDFTSIDGQAALRVARFDGSTWHALSAGIGAPAVVNAVAEYGGDVYAAGSFANAGGVACANVARFDGTAWQPLGAGLDAACEALEVHGGLLYLGGAFANADGQPFAHAAAWDGIGFVAAAANTPPVVRDFAVGAGKLYAAAKEVYSLEPGGWQQVGQIATTSVEAQRIAIVDGVPVAAGKWATFCLTWANGPCLAAARFAGGSWSLVLTDDQNPSFASLALAGLGSALYVTGGTFFPPQSGLVELAPDVAVYAASPAQAAWYREELVTLAGACLTPGAPTTVVFGASPPLPATATSENSAQVLVPAGHVVPCGPVAVTVSQGAQSGFAPAAYKVLPSLGVVVYALFTAHVDFDVTSASKNGRAWVLWSPQLGTPFEFPGMHGLFALQAAPLELLGSGVLDTTPTLRVPYVPAQVPPNASLATQAVVLEFAPGGPYIALSNAVTVVIP